MQINWHFTDGQQKEIEARRELVSRQVEDTTKLHVDLDLDLEFGRLLISSLHHFCI